MHANPYIRFLSAEVLPYLRSPTKKGLGRQLREARALWRKYQCMPYHYFKHRLYEHESTLDDVLDYVPPAVIRHFQLAANSREHMRILVDKLQTNRAVAIHGVPCIATLFYVDADGRITDGKGAPTTAEAATALLRQRGEDAFVKPIDDGVGNGAFRVSADSAEPSLFAKRKIVIQPRMQNHPELARIFPKTLNTIRVDTLIDGDDCVINAACLKVGTGGAHVDNWAQGAIAIGIDLRTGRLARRGIRKAAFGRARPETHPETGVRFADVVVPWWPETLEIARLAALALRPHQSLGLDIAITPEGPLFVEANDTGDFFLLQESCGPLGRTRLCDRALQLWLRRNAPAA
jgi:hypothetical protein